MDDQDYSERLASIARIVEVLSDRLAADQRERSSPDGATVLGRTAAPSPALINELAGLALRLQCDLDDGQSDLLPGGRTRRVSVDASTTSGLASATAVIRPWARHTASEARGVGTSPTCDGHERGGVHGVHFSRSHEHAVAAVVDMVCEAIEHGRGVVLVVTGLHRRWIEAELHQRGTHLDRERFHILDAATTLSSLVVDGKPDHDRFRAVIGTLVTDVSARAPAGVSVYGEMVGLLWEQGDAGSAIRLEELWNELQRDVPFSLMCGYLLDGRTSDSDLDPIRRLHSHVT